MIFIDNLTFQQPTTTQGHGENAPYWTTQIVKVSFSDEKWLIKTSTLMEALQDLLDLTKKITGKNPKTEPCLEGLSEKYSQLHGS